MDLTTYLKNAVQAYKNRNKPPNHSAFKSFGNRWLGEWSNNLEDRDSEWFRAKAMRDYEARVDLGLTPLPELWVWHGGKAVRIGQADSVFTVEKNGVLLFGATGTYDDNPRANAAKEFYNDSTEIHGMSHGFTYPELAKEGRVYNQFNTFELSVLPIEVAANPYTAFNSKEFQMNDKKLAYLKKVFGDDEAAKIVTEMESKAVTLSEIAEYKEFFSIEDATNPASEKDAHNHSEDAETNTALKASVADIIPEQGEQAKDILGLMKKVKTQDSSITQLLADNKAMKKQIADMEADLKAKPRAASEADETEIEDEDMLDKLKKKEAGEKDSFWTPFVEVEKS